MSDRFFTFMVIPEKGSRVRKFTLPTLYLKGASVLLAIFALIGVFVFYDYLHVMSQVAENKKLRRENHDLSREVQKAKNQLESLDQSVGRLKSFAQKLRVLGNLDQAASQKLMQAPDATSQNQFELQQEDSGNIKDPDGGAKVPEKKNQTESAAPLPNTEVPTESTVIDKKDLNIEGSSLPDQISHISSATVELGKITELEEQRYADLVEHFQDRAALLRCTPSIAPAQGWLSSIFGYRSNPFVGATTFHAGIDIANAPGTLVFAPADGVVTYASNQGGFGQVVRIDHGYGIVTKYGHNSQLLIKTGDKVKRGQKIAMMGSSGRSTGPHLHYQVEVNGKPVNPRLFILEDDF